jgi:hypothetical protein
LLKADLEALRRKYVEMQRLRLLHDRARTDATFVEPDPGPAMAALAREFPGALREIDELPIAALAARIVALDDAIADASRIAIWMRASSSFHRHARGALVVKRWLAERTDEGEARRAALERALDSLEHSDDARAWLDALAAVARPPRGRLMDLVHERVASELGLAVDEVRRAIFTQRKKS